MAASNDLNILSTIVALAASLSAIEDAETQPQSASGELARQNEILREEVKRFAASLRSA